MLSCGRGCGCAPLDEDDCNIASRAGHERLGRAVAAHFPRNAAADIAKARPSADVDLAVAPGRAKKPQNPACILQQPRLGSAPSP